MVRLKKHATRMSILATQKSERREEAWRVAER